VILKQTIKSRPADITPGKTEGFDIKSGHRATYGARWVGGGGTTTGVKREV